MTNGDYSEIVDSERELVKDRVRFLTVYNRECHFISDGVNQKLWLLLLGLIETWDMKIQ